MYEYNCTYPLHGRVRVRVRVVRTDLEYLLTADMDGRFEAFKNRRTETDRATASRKEAGNRCFKARDFEGAIKAYSDAIAHRCVYMS